MTQTFECGDTSALITYVYEECDPDMRQAIAGHLVRCPSCSSEIDGLQWTRRRLEVWTPPVSELGFQLPAPAPEPRLPWWRAPLPAWAQAVAALVIFAAGFSLGLARDVAEAPRLAETQPSGAVTTTAVTQTELAQLEQRLKAQLSEIRAAAAAPVRQATVSDGGIMKKVEALVTQSEERQRREFTLRTVEMARDFEAQRRIDMATVRETVGQFQGAAGTEIRQQREAIDRINNFIRVSQQGR
jgi:hypothetical protein